MRTEDLIAELSARPVGPRPATLERGVAVGLGLGLAVALALFLVTYGPRSDLGAALSHPAVAAKSLLPLLLGLLALPLVLSAARPGARAPSIGRAIWLVPLAAAVLFAAALYLTPPGGRLAAFIGHSIPICLPSIALLSLPIAVFLFRALRRGAPTRPARCGALAGLAAAGFATALYSTFCTEDTALFYAVWYAVGIGFVALAGAFAGKRFLSW